MRIFFLLIKRHHINIEAEKVRYKVLRVAMKYYA